MPTSIPSEETGPGDASQSAPVPTPQAPWPAPLPADPYDLDSLPEATSAASWAVPWSDLMMVMFILFATLLAVEYGSRSPQPASAAATGSRPTSAPRVEVREQPVEVPAEIPRSGPVDAPVARLSVLDRSEAAVREAGIDNVQVALTRDQGVKVSVQGPMFFELGRADLRPEVRDFLDRLAGVIANTPYDIDVVGHTDDYPVATAQFPSNWELSLHRAARVARYLIERSGVHPGRFTAMGRSMYDPAVPNQDDSQRALNRRVEIIITRRQSRFSE